MRGISCNLYDVPYCPQSSRTLGSRKKREMSTLLWQKSCLKFGAKGEKEGEDPLNFNENLEGFMVNRGFMDFLFLDSFFEDLINPVLVSR